MSRTASTGRRWLQAGAVSLAIALAVTACGTGTPTSEETAGSGTGVNADRTAVLKTPASTQIKFLDPIRLGDPSEWNILSAIYDTLLYRDPETSELIPGLATEWEQTDDVTLKLTLREGVKFQDGTDLNADAVVFNFNRALTDPNSSVKNTLYMLKYIKAVDDLTVEFNVDPNIPAFGPLLDAFTQRPGMIASPDAVAAGAANFISESAGAGMYQVENFTPGVGATVRAWDGYWNPDVALLGGIEWQSVPDPTPLFLSGAVDMFFAQQAAIGAVENDPNATILTRPSSQYYVLGINETLPPFDDELVRQAAAFAIDRDALADAQGFSGAAWQPLPPGSLGYSEDLDSTYSFDPDKSRELLEEAGYPDGGVKVRFLIGQSATSAVRALEIVQAMLIDVGFDVEIELADLATVLPRYIGDGGKTNCGTANGGFFLVKVSTPDPDFLFRQRYLKDSPQNAGCNEPSWLREAVNEAAAETDDAVRAELYTAISERAQAEVLDGIPLYLDPRNTVLQPYVGGFTVAYSGYDADWHGVYITEGREPVER